MNQRMAILRKIRTRSDEASGDRDGNGDGIGVEEEPVTPAGRVFIRPEFYCTALCILGFKQPIDVEALKRELTNTLVQHKRFSSLMKRNERGKECWVRTQVRIEDHVILSRASQSELESPGFVEDYAARLSVRKLDMNKPLWEVHVLNNIMAFPRRSASNGDEHQSQQVSGVCIFLFHHSLGDGTSLMSLFLACTRQLSNPELLPTVPKNRLLKEQRSWRQADCFGTVWRSFLVIWYTITELCKFLIMQFWQSDSQTALKGYRGAEKEPSHLSIVSLKLDDLKTVKNATNATINDVLLAIISIAVQRYLTQHTKAGEVAKLRVRALSLVNTRASPGLQELAEMMKSSDSKARWGNNIGYILVPQILSELKNPLEYVRQAKAISTRKKLSYEPQFTYSSGAFILHLLGPKAAAELTYSSTLHTTLTVSNIVGPSEAVSFAGNPLELIVPTSSGLPQGLVIHMTSYKGIVNLALMMNKKIVEDPEILLQCFTSALPELLRSC